MRDLVQRAYTHYIPRIGRRPAPMDADYSAGALGERCFVAERGTEIAGAIVLDVRPDHLFIDNVAVDPAHQGQGIGRALLDFAEARALADGHRELRLYTHAKMGENRRLYRRLGYREVAQRADGGFDRVHMVKRLDADPA